MNIKIAFFSIVMCFSAAQLAMDAQPEHELRKTLIKQMQSLALNAQSTTQPAQQKDKNLNNFARFVTLYFSQHIGCERL